MTNEFAINNKLTPPKEDEQDEIYKKYKGLISCIPAIGGFLSEMFSDILPSSVEQRRIVWMEEVQRVLLHLNKNSVSKDEFISLFIKASESALKIHQVERIRLLGNILVNSTLYDSDYFVKQTYLSFIEILSPIQIDILNFVNTNTKSMMLTDSYQDLYQLMKQDNDFFVLSDDLDINYLKYLLQELNNNGLLLISNNFSDQSFQVKECMLVSLSDNDNVNERLPYLKVSDFGNLFLKFIQEYI